MDRGQIVAALINSRANLADVLSGKSADPLSDVEQAREWMGQILAAFSSPASDDLNELLTLAAACGRTEGAADSPGWGHLAAHLDYMHPDRAELFAKVAAGMVGIAPPADYGDRYVDTDEE